MPSPKFASGYLCACVFTMTTMAAVQAAVPIQIELDKPGYVTLVVDDSAGRRVANVISETLLPAGKHSVVWDGYGLADDGRSYRRVEPGSYQVRALVHDGLKSLFEMPVYTAGNPPWFTRDGTGGWLADHTPPADVLFLPKGTSHLKDGEPQMLISSQVAEAGHALVWTDLNGRRLGGTKIGGWTGGYAVTIDAGEKPDEAASYYGMVIINPWPERPLGGLEVWQINREGQISGVVSWFPEKTHAELDAYRSAADLAVHNGIAVFTHAPNNAVIVADLKTKKLLGTITRKNPTGVAFDEQGLLYLLEDGALRRYRLDVRGTPRLESGRTIVARGLDEPRRILLHGDDLFISQWGKAHNVVVFNRDGRKLRTIGEPGGPHVGAYNERRMHHPLGLAIDPKGQLWVAECDFVPKRVSIWTQQDKLVKAFYGPSQYGGGGTLDPVDPTRFYYASAFNAGSHGGLEFKLDWDTGDAKLIHIYYRGAQPSYSRMVNFHQFFGGDDDPVTLYKSYDRSFAPYDLPRACPPERAIYLNGRQYMTNAFNGWERYNSSNGIWLMTKDGYIRPVASAGPLEVLTRRYHLYQVHVKNIAEILKKVDGMPDDRTVFVWSDLNFNGHLDVDELQFRQMPDEVGTTGGEGIYVETDLTLTTSFALELRPVRFTAEGVPVYDLAQAEQAAPVVGPSQIVNASDGWVVAAGGFTGWKDGQPRWWYPSFGGNYLPQLPGDVVQPTRLNGPVMTPTAGEAGEFFAISGEKGTIYLMTVDGYMIQTLGGDIRKDPPIRFPEAKRGLNVFGHSFEDELFHPTMTQTKDGTIYLTSGKEFTGIFRIEGLETARRRDFGTIEVTAEQLAGLPAMREAEREERAERRLVVRMGGVTPKVDGQVREWPEDGWATIDARAAAQLAIADGRLFAAFRTGDPQLTKNGADDPTTMFIRGGALDVSLRTWGGDARRGPSEGDLRLLIAEVRGKPTAVLYQPVVADAKPELRAEFVSPVGRVNFDSVREVSDALQYAGDGAGSFEFSLPLETLSWNPNPDVQLAGDLGVLRGDGNDTTQRIYWSNRNTSIVSDVPSEARLQPQNWGVIQIRDVGSAVLRLDPADADLSGPDLRKKREGGRVILGFWSHPNATATWNLHVPNAGSYQVDVTYGLAVGAGGPFKLTVGGQAVSATLKETGGWDQHQTLTLGTVKLPAGPAKLTIKPSGEINQGLMDLAGVKLSPAD